MGPMRYLVRCIPVSLLALSMSLPSQPAWAQLSTAPAETIPLRIKVGVLRPNSSTTRTLSGSQVLGGMIDLSNSRSAGARTLTAGYFQGSSNGRSFRVAPLLVTKERSNGSSASNLAGFYTSEGFGAYFIDAAGSGFKSRIGGYIGAGLHLTGGLFVEAQYHYVSGSVNGASPNGIAIFIGRRN